MNPLLQFSGPGSMTFLHRQVNLSFLLPVSELPAYVPSGVRPAYVKVQFRRSRNLTRSRDQQRNIGHRKRERWEWGMGIAHRF